MATRASQSQLTAEAWARLRKALADPVIEMAAYAESERVVRPLDRMASDDVFRSLVIQICAVGGAARAYALRDNPSFNALSPGQLVGLTAAEAARQIHAVLRGAGIRYVGSTPAAAKVQAVVAWLRHPAVVRAKACVFGATVMAARERHPFTPDGDRALREQLLGERIPFLGRKSVSDWLANHGMARHVLAIDSRVARVLSHALSVKVTSELVAKREHYERWESACQQHLAEPLGIDLAEVDKRLFVVGGRSRLE